MAIRPEIWHEKLHDKWTPGEAGAQEKLKAFLSNGLNGYSEGRNRPDKQHTSMLSPHIRFGEISIREVAKSIENVNTEDAEIFYKELVWREFSYHLLYHFLIWWIQIFKRNSIILNGLIIKIILRVGKKA